MPYMHAFTRAAAAALVSVAFAGTARAEPVVGPFAPGYIGVLDNSVALLLNAHPGDLDGFFDVYAFTVSNFGGVFGLTFSLQAFDPTFDPINAATIGVIALLDGDSNLLAIDNTADDGFLLSALLPAAGNYAFVVGGVGGVGAGAYAGLLATSVVPEPGSYGLAALGLGLAAATARRRRKA